MTRAHRPPPRGPRTARRLLPSLIGAALGAGASHAATPLADAPVFSSVSVPGNLALALSVEFPTAVSVAHVDGTYNSANTYLGYFDPNKCYDYFSSGAESGHHFYPAGKATNRTCSGKWSGNFMNWATMQTIDTFRWVLTGGQRTTDTATQTIIEKAWASGQGGASNFPNRTLSGSTVVSGAIPYAVPTVYMRVQGLGNKVRFSHTDNVDSAPGTGPAGTPLEFFVRVKVCDATAAAGGIETSNCTLYPNGNYKPTGLMQQYAEQIRYAAFGYVNDNIGDDANLKRDGGVLRSKMKFIGPKKPGTNGALVANDTPEWDANTGVMTVNPHKAAEADPAAAAYGVTVPNSGVMNYLNKFGQSSHTYKHFDPVGELYYTTLRYFKNLGNVPEYTSITRNKDTALDGFPIITDWDDPIMYSCQRNFVLGIGDVNTHADRNLPGATGASEPSKPGKVAGDATVDAVKATNKVGLLHGMGASLGLADLGSNNNGALMAGLAYDANTVDIRPDDPQDLPRTKGKQTVQTYWMDVLEYQTYKQNNQFYLAAKYGGFTVPEDFDPYARTTDLPEAWWHTTTDTVYGQLRPDNYFTASQPDQVVFGLTKMFESIASKLKPYTTSFQTALPQIASKGTGSYSTRYAPKTWSGELAGSLAKVDPKAASPSLTEVWTFSSKLDAQAAVTGSGSSRKLGWDTGRNIVTWNGKGVPFRYDDKYLSAAQKSALDTSYVTGNDGANYLNYLRGDRTYEKSSTAAGTERVYRERSTLLGDIVNAKARAVAAPNMPYSNAANPGYAEHKTKWKDRPTMVYVGTNAGMLHAVNGSVTTADGGTEVFAYVPGALFTGPTATPNTTGLAALGNPAFSHRNFVDAPPVSGDVDFGRTKGNKGAADWRTILVGGLGKGGKAVYALDITNPTDPALKNETDVAAKVLWEYTDPDGGLGYTYGEPAIVKLKQYGWVVIFGSGYNNADGKGYLYILDAKTGTRLDKIPTNSGTTTDDAGLAQVQAFVPDRTDGTADSVYAGDMNGKLWRFDLSAASGAYPAGVQLAQLNDSAENPLAVTSRPLIVVQPGTGRRWVTVGTGRLLASGDVSSTQSQRFFAFVDGNNDRIMKSTELPSGVSWPFNATKLEPLTDLTKKISVDFSSKMGWYIDLGVTAGSNAWRVISDSTSYYGVVAFPAMQPTTSNPCEPTGTNRVYAVDLGTGQSRLKSGNTTIAYATTLSGVVTDLRFYSATGTGATAQGVLVGGADTGENKRIDGTWGPGTQLRRLNWREVPLAD